MKFINTLLSALLVFTISSVAAAEEVATMNLGNAEVIHDYHLTETGVATLTLNAVVTETNNSLRGLKNTDRRRLSKLGQLIYQCKLMLYQPDKSKLAADLKDPILISKNFSLFTGVDVPLAADELVGVRAQVLPTVDDASLFTATLGGKQKQDAVWETVGEDAAVNLRQFDVNVLSETNLIKTSESIDFTIRFPVFQLKKPVNQWIYNFNLKDFKRALTYIDENCTPVKLVDLINRNG